MSKWICMNMKGQGHSLTLVLGSDLSDSRFSNFFSLETARLIEAKFHVDPPWDGGTKVSSTGQGHMTKMAAMPIYGKNIKKSSLEPKGWRPWKLICNIEYLSTAKYVQMMTLGWPWPILLGQGQFLSLMLLYGKKVKQWIFQKLL